MGAATTVAGTLMTHMSFSKTTLLSIQFCFVLLATKVGRLKLAIAKAVVAGTALHIASMNRGITQQLAAKSPFSRDGKAGMTTWP